MCSDANGSLGRSLSLSISVVLRCPSVPVRRLLCAPLLQPSTARLLCGLNASLNAQDSQLRNTALHYAIYGANYSVVTVLVTAGARCDIANEEVRLWSFKCRVLRTYLHSL